MEEPKIPPSQDAPAAATPQAMDIVPPVTKVADAPSNQPAAGSEPVEAPKILPETPAVTASTKPKAVKSPKVHANGMALPIVATVLIVLALGGMMVYAYLRTKAAGSP